MAVGDDFGDMARLSDDVGSTEGWKEISREDVGRVKWDVYMPLIPIRVYKRGFCESAKEIK